MCLHVSPILFQFQLLWYFFEHLTLLFANWHKIHWLSMTLGVSWVPHACHPIPGKSSWNFLCFSPMLVSLSLHNITYFRVRMNPELHFKGSNSSLCDRLLGGGLDALSFLQFSSMHLLLSGHIILDWIGVLLTLYLPCGRCHLRLCCLIPGLYNMDRLHIVALLYDHLTKIRHHGLNFLHTSLFTPRQH